MYRTSTFKLRPRKLLAAFIVFVTFLALPFPANAQEVPDCGGVSVVLFRGEEAIFVLPENYGERFTVEPDDLIRVVAMGLPPTGRVEFTALLPFGGRLKRSESWSDLTPGVPSELELDLSEYSDFTRGAFDVEVAIFAGSDPICVVKSVAAVDGFGGVAAVGSTAATGVSAGVTAVAVAQGASSANVKINSQVAVRRRGRKGWKRLLPVIAWRKTIWATITGAITGLFAAIALQQTGQLVLDTTTVAGGAAAGGGISLGVNLAWGSLISLVKSSGGRIDEDAEEAVDTVSDTLNDTDNQGL